MEKVKGVYKCEECGENMVDVFTKHYYVEEDNGSYNGYGETLYTYSECFTCGWQPDSYDPLYK